MQRSLGLVSLTLLAVVGHAHAADDMGGFVDLRLGYETFNTKYRLEYPGVDAKENFDVTHRLTLTWLGTLGLSSHGGVLWGLGGSWYYNNDDQLPAGTGGFSYQTWLAQAHLGYGLPIGQNMQVEVVPYAGFGRSYLRLENFPNPSATQNGEDATWEAGVNAAFIYTFDNGFQLGANGRYFLTESSIEEEAGVGRFRVHIRDFSVGMTLGVRL